MHIGHKRQHFFVESYLKLSRFAQMNIAKIPWRCWLRRGSMVASPREESVLHAEPGVNPSETKRGGGALGRGPGWRRSRPSPRGAPRRLLTLQSLFVQSQVCWLVKEANDTMNWKMMKWIRCYDSEISGNIDSYPQMLAKFWKYPCFLICPFA